MNVEFYSIGSEVCFIDNNQKIAYGYVSEIDFNMKKAPNSDGYSSLFTQNTVYVIDDKFRRNAKFVFKSRKELIESL